MGSAIVVANQPGVRPEDGAGTELLVKDTTTITPASQPVVPTGGVDGTTLRTHRVDASGRQKVQADALPLPAGAATEAKLEAVRALVASLDGKDFATQATLVTLATEAKLEAVRALLATIDADTGALAATDFATEATQAAVLQNSADIETILTAIRDTAGIKKITDPVELAPGDPGGVLIGSVKIRGSDGLHDANVDASHRLSTTSALVIPAGFVDVSIIAQSLVAGSSAVDTDHVVPDTKTLSISQFFGGGEVQTGKQSKFELYHSTDGGATDGTLIAFGYIGAENNFRVDLNHDVLGVGVSQVIRMRRERLDGVTLELSAGWIGIETI